MIATDDQDRTIELRQLVRNGVPGVGTDVLLFPKIPADRDEIDLAFSCEGEATSERVEEVLTTKPGAIRWKPRPS